MTDMPNSGNRRRPSEQEMLKAVPATASGREVRVGIFVLMGLISFIAVLFLLTDPATLRGRYILVTQVEHAGGIRRGDPIQMRGVNVGRIHGFEMEPDGRVAITMEMEGQWQIPQDSRTRMGASGIFGGRTLEIMAGSSRSMLSPWDTLPGGEGGGGGLLDGVDDLGAQAGTVLDRIEALLNENTVASVQGSASELEGLLSQLSAVTAEQRGALKRLTESLAASAENMEEASPGVSRAIARADSAMVALNQTSVSLDNAAASLRAVLARIERGEGTLGKLSQDDSLYNNLNRAAESVASLMQDIQANPNKYINVSLF